MLDFGVKCRLGERKKMGSLKTLEMEWMRPNEKSEERENQKVTLYQLYNFIKLP